MPIFTLLVNVMQHCKRNRMKGRPLLCCLLFGISTIANAQWELTSGPYGGDINCLVQNITTHTVFAATDEGFYRYKSSVNKWENLKAMDAEIPDYITKIGVADSQIFIASLDGLHKSADDGETWTRVFVDTNVQTFSMLYCGDSLLVLKSNNGIYLSTNSGTSFTHVTWNIGFSAITDFIPVGNRFLIIRRNGSKESIFYSDDSGQSWCYSMTILNNGIIIYPTRFRSYANKVYLVNPDSIYISDNKGETWQILPVNVIQGPIYSDIVVSGSNVFISTQCCGGILVSSDYGQTYSQVYNGFPQQNVGCNQLLNTISFGLLAATNLGVYRSNDLGASWSDFNYSLFSTRFKCFTDCNNELFVASDNMQGVFSTLDGVHWDRKSHGLEINTHFNNIEDMISVGDRLIVSTGSGLSTFYSENNGLNWYQSGDISGSQGRLEYADGRLYNCTTQGLYFSVDTAKSWHVLESEPPFCIFDIKAHDNWMIFTDNYYNWSTGTSVSVMKRSGDYGNTITNVNTHFVFSQVELIDSLLLAKGEYLIRSTDEGLTWDADFAFKHEYLSYIYVYDNKYVFVGLNNGRIYYSPDKAQHWLDLTDNFIGIPRSIYVYGAYLYVSSSKCGIWRRNISGVIDFFTSPFLIYPNPTSDNITIENRNLINDAVFSIINTAGQVVWKGTIIGLQAKISLINFAKGLYIIDITSNSYHTTTKFVKN